MAISFPRELPPVAGLQTSFRIERRDLVSGDAAGRIYGVTEGFPLWRMSITFNNLIQVKADKLEAWIDSLRGPQRRFYGYDTSRPFPRFHSKGVPFEANPSGWSQSIDDDGTAYLTLTGLLPGQVVSHRDYVGFEWDDTKRSLVRAIEAVQANASGEATFAIEPPVPAVTPALATVNLREASCLMKLVAEETSIGETTLGYVEAGSRIVGIQDLVP